MKGEVLRADEGKRLITGRKKWAACRNAKQLPCMVVIGWRI